MSTENDGSFLSEEELAALDKEIADTENTSEEALEETLIKRAAAMVMKNATQVSIQKALGISAAKLKSIRRSDRFKQIVEEVGESAIVETKASVRTEIAKMGKSAVTALQKNLDKHSLEAVKVFLRAIGLEQEKDGEKKDQAFVLTLASPLPPKPGAITVKTEDEE